MRFYTNKHNVFGEGDPPVDDPEFPGAKLRFTVDKGVVNNPLSPRIHGQKMVEAHYEVELPDILALCDCVKEGHNLTITEFGAPQGYPDPPAYKIELLNWLNMD